MTKIILNNVEFQLEAYNRNTYFNGNTMSSNASISIGQGDIDALCTLGKTIITSLEIQINDETIYTLNNIHAKINELNEYFNGERISTNMSLTFDNV